jgi:hypothetical protein
LGLDEKWSEYTLCPADLSRFDHRVEFVEARLGVRRDEPVTIYVVDSDREDGWGPPQCSEGTLGCYAPAEDLVFTSFWSVIDHEIVHAVTRDIDFPSLFWSEGAAELLSGKTTRKDLRVTLEPKHLEVQTLETYITAAHFSRFLVETRGWDGYNRIIRGESFDAVYGESAGEVTDEYEREAPFAYPPLEPCPYPDLSEPDDGVWEDAFSLSCQDEASTGTEWPWGPTVFRTVELEAGTYAFRFRGGFRYFLLGCHTDTLLDEPAPPSNGDLYNEVDYATGTQFPPTGTHVLELTEGLYRLAAVGWHDESFDAEYYVTRVDWTLPEE